MCSPSPRKNNDSGRTAALLRQEERQPCRVCGPKAKGVSVNSPLAPSENRCSSESRRDAACREQTGEGAYLLRPARVPPCAETTSANMRQPLRGLVSSLRRGRLGAPL